ncbi:hypothetical protein [Erwinia sp. ErVv1]|uniref:HofO family protein n=1 Tax=Erwinia sp. ErVv1 TaxID=1603299 RepID=UPI00082F9408|nr:hypothetical protein [Erwinia sp. ErVv1]
MINTLLFRWITLPWHYRLMLFLLLAGGLSIATDRGYRAPADRQSAALAAEQRKETRRYPTILRSIASSGSLNLLEADISQLEAALLPVEPGRRFSLVALLEMAGGELRLWQPDATGAALVLSLSWPQVQKVLAYLSGLPGAAELPHFTLKPEEERLLFHLGLVLNDAE